MQATTCFHDGIPNAVPQQAYLVFHDPIAFHTTNGVFDTDSDRRDLTIVRFLRWREFSMTGLLLRLDDRDPIACKALEPQILIEATAAGEGIAHQIREAFVMRLPLVGVAQEAHMTDLIDHEEVFDRVTLLLAAGVVLLVLWIDRAMDRSLSTIRPQRGGRGTPSVRLAPSITDKSSALRAGSSS